MSFRRFFIASLLILIIGTVSVGVVYLYNFDLNSFREEIETLVSERISKQITLGKARLSIKHGPAFVFNHVTIGNDTDDLYLDADKVFFRIQSLPLLSGDILFSEILLEKPTLKVQVEQSETTSDNFQVDPDQRLLTGELIKSLRVLNGTLKVIGPATEKESPQFVIEKINFSVDDFSVLNAGNINANAILSYRGIRSPFSFSGKYQPNKDSKSWDEVYYHLTFSIKNLSAEHLDYWPTLHDHGYALRGNADLDLLIEGRPQTETSISTKLTGHNLRVIKPGLNKAPVTISQANLSGHIKHKKNVVELDMLKLNLDTDQGRFETINEASLSFSDAKLVGLASKGRVSVRLTSDPEQSEKHFFSRNLMTSYQIDLIRTKFGWKATTGQLSIPGVEIGLRGQWHDSGEQPHVLTLDIPGASIPAVTALMPGLNRLKLGGRFDAHLNLNISKNRPVQTVGTVHLIDVHLAIPGKLADLNQLNGNIQIDDKTIVAKGLKADLGQSPITVDLDIPDITTPNIKLHVLSDSIRADELIFSSDSRFLKEVDGIVQIADNAVFLGPIHVKMDGGTDATVHGTVRNFAAADVALEIEGRHGNIDEIIALWQTDHPPPPNTHHKPLGSLIIDIKTDSGQISGMFFDHATSKIVLRNEALVIGPINFRAGDGKGLGLVVLVHQEDGSSLLKISGNLENFDALTVYSQILKRKGLVEGRLNGDFYLEGIAGKQFLPTSLGAFSVAIENGRLHKLTGLGKILHFLNLYPILTENVQGKGLPFDQISFNASLNKGTLSTDDYLMKGSIMNLSMTGGYDLINNDINFDLAAMPLSTVDNILSRIPIAGWLLTGKEKALVVAHFKMTGDADDPKLKSVPLDSVTTPVLGILKRVFTFPVEIITDPEKVIINQ